MIHKGQESQQLEYLLSEPKNNGYFYFLIYSFLEILNLKSALETQNLKSAPDISV